MAGGGRPGQPRPPVHGQPQAPDATTKHIVDSIESAPPARVYQIMRELKAMALHNPDRARELLTTQPQLCFAFLQALLKMNLIDTKTAESMLAQSSGGGRGVAAAVGVSLARSHSQSPRRPRATHAAAGRHGADAPVRGMAPLSRHPSQSPPDISLSTPSRRSRRRRTCRRTRRRSRRSRRRRT